MRNNTKSYYYLLNYTLIFIGLAISQFYCLLKVSMPEKHVPAGWANLDLQKDALIRAGVGSERIYHDYTSVR